VSPRRASFGLPPIRTVPAKLAVALVVGSLLATFLPTLALHPGDVLSKLTLWQLVTYSFVELSAMGVIFGALILWSIGGSLEQTWGTRRLLTFALGVTVMSAVLTVALAPFIPLVAAYTFGGGTVMTSALWVAFGLSWGTRQTNFFGIPVTGNVLALIGAGFVVLNAAFSSIWVVIPSAFGIAMAFLYVKLNFPGGTWERFNSWRLRRQLDKRRNHLNVVSGDKRNMPSDSDRFLH
jgi:membrane associated rhomboid family serine protease